MRIRDLAALLVAALAALASAPRRALAQSAAGHEGVPPALIGRWASVDRKTFDLLPRDFLNANGIEFKDVTLDQDVTRFRKGVFEEASGAAPARKADGSPVEAKKGFYVSFTCRPGEPGYYTAVRRTDAGELETEFGVVYRRLFGPVLQFSVTYNVAFVRNSRSETVAVHALKRDQDASEVSEATTAPGARMSQCGFARLTRAGGA